MRVVFPLVTACLLLVMALASQARAGAAAPLEVSGFVDASYAANLELGEDGFGLDQVEVDLIRGCGERGALRADLEWVKDGDAWAVVAEQGFVTYAPPAAGGLAFTLGKFNAPIGFELLDAPDMFQYSHALVFDHGLPTNLTGLLLARDLGGGLDLQAFLVNGWDDNHLDEAGPKTAGGRLGFAGGALSLGLSGIRGETLDASGAAPVRCDRSVVDVDLTYQAGEALLVGAEFNRGQVEYPAADADWMGFLVMAHLDLNAWLGFTGRYDWFDDPDGYVFGLGSEETRSAVTIAPTFALGEGMGALIELRMDMSSEDVFADGEGGLQGSTTTVACEATFSF